jgi:hypothetical protein
MSQLITVAIVTGAISLSVRRSRLEDNERTAASCWPLAMSFNGFIELTHPEIIKKSATHGNPVKNMYMKGHWRKSAALASASGGNMVCGWRTSVRWLKITKQAARPRRP